MAVVDRAISALKLRTLRSHKERVNAPLKSPENGLSGEEALEAARLDKFVQATAGALKGEGLANENPYHCPQCGKFSGFNGHCDKCGYTLDADETQKRTERLIDKAMSGTMLKPIDDLSYRDEIGQIDLEVGRKGEGINMERRNKTMASI